jgi:hypothetical protein
VSTHQGEDSAATVDLHAKLGGKVNVNFKSETFPLDKMADVLKMNQIQQKAPAGMRIASAAAPAPSLAPAPQSVAAPAAPGR